MQDMVPTIIIFTGEEHDMEKYMKFTMYKRKQQTKNIVQILIVQLTLQEILREILYARMDVNFF